MNEPTDVDGAAWAWERLEAMAQRWRDTPEWHEGPFHEGRIHVTTAELHAAAILCYRKSLGLEGGAASPPPATGTDERPANCWGPQWCDNSPCTCRGPKQREVTPGTPACESWCGCVHDQVPLGQRCYLTALLDNRLHAFCTCECMLNGAPLHPAPGGRP